MDCWVGSDSMVSGVSGKYIHRSIETFISHNNPMNILYKAHPHHTLSLTQIAPLHPALIPSVKSSYGRASFASFSTA